MIIEFILKLLNYAAISIGYVVIVTSIAMAILELCQRIYALCRKVNMMPLEIVHCFECRYYSNMERECDMLQRTHTIHDNDYCSRGVKK